MKSADSLELYDHIFSPKEAQAVKDFLQSVAAHHAQRARPLIAAGWHRILHEAHGYETRQAQGPIRKERIGRAINTLVKRFGNDSLAVRIVRGDGLPRGRPRGGKADRDRFIAVVCQVYQLISGRKPALTWDPVSSRPSGKLLELLRAALAPEVFHEKGRPLTVGAIASAVKRVRKRGTT